MRAALQAAADPLVIDLGYGALPVTTLELAARLRVVRADVRVVGLEIHPERVVPLAAARRWNSVLGGFELAGRKPVLVRAFNVLRQYPVDDGAGRVGGDAGRAGAGRADRRRHLRRAGPPLLLGAAGRRRARSA